MAGRAKGIAGYVVDRFGFEVVPVEVGHAGTDVAEGYREIDRAVLVVNERSVRVEIGREEIGRFLAERQADTARRTAHVIANEVFAQVAPDRVTLQARVVLLVHQREGGYRADQVVETNQTFVRDDSHWRIARRDESPLHADHP